MKFNVCLTMTLKYIFLIYRFEANEPKKKKKRKQVVLLTAHFKNTPGA